MPSVHDEVEIKYDVDADFDVPPLPSLLDGLLVESFAREGDVARHRLEATYFDTADHLLARARVTLRRRTGGDDAGWHLKVPAPGGDRVEVRQPLGRAVNTVPAALRRMVWVITRDAALAKVARISTDRTSRPLLDATGRVLLVLADDRVEAQRFWPTDEPGDTAGAAVSWREIEVELVEGDRALLAGVDARLGELGIQRASSGSKLARVLDDGEAAPVPTPTTPGLSKKSTAGDIVLAYLGEQVGEVLSNDVNVRLARPDSVHRMRVATRRLRSALQTFKPVFEAEAVRPLRAELKWLAGALGAARDAEVLHERLSNALEAELQDGPAISVAGSATRETSQDYRTARDRLLTELDGDRYRRLVVALDDLVSAPPFTDRAAAPAAKFLRRRVRRTYAALRDLVAAAQDAASYEERDHLLHETRKAAKRARYAGEAMVGVFGRRARAFATAMEGLQEVLGEHQDSVVMRERLVDLARHDTAPGAAFAYGRLYAHEEARGALAEKHFKAAWRTSSKKSLRRWLR